MCGTYYGNRTFTNCIIRCSHNLEKGPNFALTSSPVWRVTAVIKWFFRCANGHCICSPWNLVKHLMKMNSHLNFGSVTVVPSLVLRNFDKVLCKFLQTAPPILQETLPLYAAYTDQTHGLLHQLWISNNLTFLGENCCCHKIKKDQLWNSCKLLVQSDDWQMQNLLHFLFSLTQLYIHSQTHTSHL